MNQHDTSEWDLEHPDHQHRSHRAAIESALRADARVSMWLCDPLDDLAGRMLLRTLSLPDLRRLAVMPDVHASADVCVGTVPGTSELVFPAAIGGDIGCGMGAVKLSCELDDAQAQEILAGLARTISVISRRVVLPPAATRETAPEQGALCHPSLRKLAAARGPSQLGTLGRGNHFVEVQRDEAGSVWIMVHSGSRSIGQAVAQFYVNAAQREGVRAAMCGLHRASALGEGYLRDQEWCVRYARANRSALLSQAAEAVRRVCGGQADWSTHVDSPHNIVAVERHAGEEFIVHRKGAASAASGQTGLIPGSAGTMSVHVTGRGEARALGSSSHGAGRLLSRSEAKVVVSEREVKELMRGVAFEAGKARGPSRRGAERV